MGVASVILAIAVMLAASVLGFRAQSAGRVRQQRVAGLAVATCLLYLVAFAVVTSPRISEDCPTTDDTCIDL